MIIQKNEYFKGFYIDKKKQNFNEEDILNKWSEEAEKQFIKSCDAVGVNEAKDIFEVINFISEDYKNCSQKIKNCDYKINKIKQETERKKVERKTRERERNIARVKQEKREKAKKSLSLFLMLLPAIIIGGGILAFVIALIVEIVKAL